jgi:hypothetical protein
MLLSGWRLSCNIIRAARSSTPFTLRRSLSSLPIRVRKGTTRIVPSGVHRARSVANVSPCSMYQAAVSTGSNNGPIMPARMRSWAARRLVFATSSLCSISLRGNERLQPGNCQHQFVVPPILVSARRGPIWIVRSHAAIFDIATRLWLAIGMCDRKIA